MTYFNLNPVKKQKGVYILHTKDELAYVGKSNNILRRLQQHFHITVDDSSSELWKKDIDRVEYYICNSLVDCELLETYLINILIPKYNLDKVYSDSTSFLLTPIPKLQTLEVIDVKQTKYVYKELLREYCKLIQEDIDNTRILEIESICPEIKESVKLLGVKTIGTLKYIKKSIEKAIHNNNESTKEILRINLAKRLEPNVFYSTKAIKTILTEEFSKLNVTRSIKANIIHEYINIEYKAKKINKKVVRGYQLNL